MVRESTSRVCEFGNGEMYTGSCQLNLVVNRSMERFWVEHPLCCVDGHDSVSANTFISPGMCLTLIWNGMEPTRSKSRIVTCSRVIYTDVRCLQNKLRKQGLW